MSYLDAALPLMILMFSFAFSLVGGSFLGNMVLLPSKQENTYMWICCITAVFNVVLNFILIPYGGAKAAAFTTALSSLLIMILLIIKKDKRIKLDYILQVSASPVIGSAVIVIYCKIVGLFVTEVWGKTVICIIGSAILYGVVLIVMKNDLCLDILKELKERKRKV